MGIIQYHMKYSPDEERIFIFVRDSAAGITYRLAGRGQRAAGLERCRALMAGPDFPRHLEAVREG